MSNIEPSAKRVKVSENFKVNHEESRLSNRVEDSLESKPLRLIDYEVDTLKSVSYTNETSVTAYAWDSPSDEVIEEMKLVLLINKRLEICKNITYSILFQMAPRIPKTTILRFFINTQSLDVLGDMVDLSKEFAAIETMRDMAACEGIDKFTAQCAFDDNYGLGQEQALKAMINEFGMLPSEVLSNDAIRKDFVNQSFINVTKAGYNPGYPDVNLSELNLIRLPSKLLAHKDIKSLNVSNNDLNFLPEWIGEFSSLEKLHISNNEELSILPQSIGKLTKLKKLYAHTCALSSIPNSIGNLSNLVKLQLGANFLKFLPEEQMIRLITQLDFLDLGENSDLVMSDELQASLTEACFYY